MTVVRSGPTKGYSENWERVFGKKKTTKAKPKAAAKKAAKKTRTKKKKA